MHLERRFVFLLIAISVAALMDGLDGSIVNVALPVIAEAFSTDAGTVSWVAMTYLIMVAGTILIFGNIAARGHIKKTYIIGFALFGAASAVCGFAPTLEILIGARIIQGIGASMIIACAPVICVKYLPPRILGFSFGIMTAATSVGFAVGPALGGILTHYLSWNWIFLINVPIALFAILFVFRVIPAGRAETVQKFDTVGAVLLFAAITSGTYVLERFPHLGLSDLQILLAGAVCIAALTAFIITEMRNPTPLINIRLFRHFPITGMFIAFFIIQIGYCGISYLLPFYLSNTAGMDSLAIGLYLLIPPVITAVFSVPFGRWSDRTRQRRWFCTASCAVLCLCGGIFGVIVPEWGLLPLLAALFCLGFCIGLESGPASGKCVEVMPEADRQTGSTLVMTLVFFGAVAGIALYAAVFTLLSRSGGVVLSFADLPADLFLSGFHTTMIIGAVLSAVAVVLMAVIRDAGTES